MALSESSLKRMCNYILQNADNNPDHEMLLKPADFCYDLSMAGTEECKKILLESNMFSMVSIEATNLLRIRLKE